QRHQHAARIDHAEAVGIETAREGDLASRFFAPVLEYQRARKTAVGFAKVALHLDRAAEAPFRWREFTVSELRPPKRNDGAGIVRHELQRALEARDRGLVLLAIELHQRKSHPRAP